MRLYATYELHYIQAAKVLIQDYLIFVDKLYVVEVVKLQFFAIKLLCNFNVCQIVSQGRKRLVTVDGCVP